MANPIKPKSTTTASKVPGSGDLITGELASNLADGVLFLKKSDGTIVTFNTGGVSSVSGTGTVSGLTLTGTVTSSGNLTLGGSLEVDGYGLPFNGITSGTITLQAVAAAGTNTITLPAITGNLITDADSGTVINKMLDNDSVTVTAGTGLSGGGTVALGGTITLDNDGVTAAAVSGTGLSISGSTGSVTITSNATDANTASTIVARDASGNFSAGTITASLSGNATNVTGTVAIANGGTGKTTQQAAINALTGTQSSGKYLRSDGTNATLASIQSADVPTLNQNTTGSSASCTGNAATATSLAGGGAGQIPYQSSANTSAFLSAGTSGQVLRSNGTNAPSWEVQGLFHGGRLTLTSGTPVTTSDVTAATTIYYTPFMGDKISLSDGTNWATYTFTERSLLLSGLTANRNYDVYLYNNAGTLTLEALVWNSLSDSNTRTTSLVLTSGGVYTKSGDATRRYVGTFRTTGTTGQTEDSTSKRFVWNYTNRVSRMILKQYVSSTWTNNVSNTYRYLGNNSANSVSIVNGIQEDNIFLVAASVSSASGIQRQLAIGFNSEWSGTSVGNSTSQYSATAVQAETNNESYNAFANRIPGLGYQVAYAIELQNSTTTVTYYGGVESGISGIWRC